MAICDNDGYIEVDDLVNYIERHATQGPIGPQGPQGVEGPRGYPGPTGPQGIRGPIGPRGADGDDGVSIRIYGSDTIDNILVNTGNDGEIWIATDTNLRTSIPGRLGDGYIWYNGQWNNIGAIRGPKGDIGPQGSQGTTGPEGPQGPIGPEGPQGPAGKDGAGVTIAGADTIANILAMTPSAVGEMWLANNDDPNASIPGKTGDGYVWNGSAWQNVGAVRGPEGPQGSQGPSGPQGPEGPMGPEGPVGLPGAEGPQGPQGPQGPKGDNGADGFNPYISDGSDNNITGHWIDATGDTGIPAQGPAGPVGPEGPQGAEGPQGPKGDPGDPSSLIDDTQTASDKVWSSEKANHEDSAIAALINNHTIDHANPHNVTTAQIGAEPALGAGTKGQVLITEDDLSKGWVDIYTGYKNILINPEFKIDQRGASFSSPVDGFVYDRWKLVSGTDCSQTIEDGNYIKGAQYILTAEANDGSLWQSQKTAPSAGGNWTITVDSLDRMRRVQLELGTRFTGWEIKPLGLEMLLCQRYYQKTGENNVSIPYGGFMGGAMFVVKMRTSPTVTLLSSQALDSTSVDITGGAVALIDSSGFGRITVNGVSGVIDGKPIRFSYEADAEL